ncbi:glycoside hydrolase family 31 protein [Rhodothermus profundi]|uniref:glycoside hydrolase family 31 protein n=1 Tax=Rhodothermus profundi TaxID=633813 RepID=UPI001FE2728A|nr:TIM-barrel domain-containing protein [Rhodothermus profundi]
MLYLWGDIAPNLTKGMEFLGALTEYQDIPGGLELQAGQARLRIRALADGIFQIWLHPDGQPFPAHPFSYAVRPECFAAAPPPVTCHLQESHLVLTQGSWRVVVQRDPVRLWFEGAAGVPLAADSFGMCWENAHVSVWKKRADGERFFGLGEKTGSLERTGRAYENWNTDDSGYDTRDDPLYKTIPFYLALRPTLNQRVEAYGIFFDNTFRSWFDFGGCAPEHVSFGADGGELVYYFLAGPAPADVLSRYTWLTGRFALPPRWALGYHQSRWSYYPEAVVRALVSEFRARRLPLDVVHLDIHYMDGYRIFTWDSHRFPNPHQLAEDLRKEGVRLVTIVDPGVKIDPGYPVHDEGLAENVFVRYPDGSLYEGNVWPGRCYFPDFTDPRARAWFGRYVGAFLRTGVAGFWCDMNEPSVFKGGTMPDLVVHCLEGRGGTHREAHNVYGLLMARSVWEAYRTHMPEQRPFVITRAAYAGVQRYACVWTGDNVADWSHLRQALTMMLSLGLSGQPFSGSDIGGFIGTPSPELYARWIQLGACSPLFRTHTAYGTPAQEPWSFGEEVEAIARKYLTWRYQLLPYLYTCFEEHQRTGLPVLRPLWLHYFDDPRTFEIDDSFLLGPHLLVAPVLEPGAQHRRVYLPAGRWYDFWSNRAYEGPDEILVEAPLDVLPVFVRAGTVLPLGPALQHTDEPCDTLQLHVYPGQGHSLLYEDDGHSWAYETGAFRRTTFMLEATSSALSLRVHVEGSYHSPIKRFHLCWHHGEGPTTLYVDGQPIASHYDATHQHITAELPAFFTHVHT